MITRIHTYIYLMYYIKFICININILHFSYILLYKSILYCIIILLCNKYILYMYYITFSFIISIIIRQL